MIKEKEHNVKYNIAPLQSLLDLGHYEQLEEACLSILDSNLQPSPEYLAHIQYQLY